MNRNSILDLARRVLLSVMVLLGVSQVQAQVTGTKTIGVDYPSLATAITDLNTNGISGAVVINLPAGYAETAPAGGFLLGSAALNTTTASGSLTFQKSGTGANPVLTANAGTSTTLDGIFTLLGTDNVVINGIDLAEAPTNTTSTLQMEWGYGLVKLQNTAPFDGCQNVTIQNCTITLAIANTASAGIYSGNHISTATTALTLTTAGDAMSNCKFYSNTIQNVNTGISLRGYAASSPYTLYDQGNDVGGASAATANTIRNYGGTAAGSGVNLRYQNDVNVSYNNINNTAGGGTPSTNTLYGVYAQNGTNASANITSNVINLTEGTSGSVVYGVNISYSGTGTINVNNNTFTAGGGSTGAMHMIYINSGNSVVNTNNNNFANINVATTGNLYLVNHSSAATTASITCNDNFTSGTASPYINKTGAGGTVACYWSNSTSSGGFSIINNNNFSNITLAGAPTFYGIDETNGGSGQNKLIRNNVISNVTTAGGTSYGLRLGYAATINASRNRIFNMNAAAGNVYGIYMVNGTTDTVGDNRVSNLTATSGNAYGVYIDGGTTHYVYRDTINTLSASGTSGLAYGVWQGGGTTLSYYQNAIYDILAGGTGSSANGMYINAGTTTLYNNIIADIRTPNQNSTTGTRLVGLYLGAGTAHNAYYNTVYLNGASTGTDFGSAAVYASATPQVTLRNNIFVNVSTPAGAGMTVAYRRSSATLTTYQAASNNNLFYAGVPGAANLIYYDGTTPYTTLPAYKSLATPRDGNSVTEAPPFVSTSGTSAGFLQISTTVPTQIESGAVNISGIATDYLNAIRAGNTGYTGTGTAPDIGAFEGNYSPSDLSGPNITYTAIANACTTGDRTFTVTITDGSGVPTAGTFVPRVYFRKGTGTWFSAPGGMVAGTATNSIWTFNIAAATMGGLAIGDVVSYFVIAQDVAPAGNIGANPGAGIAATDVNTVTTYPTTPSTFTVLPTLSGTYTVGVGMTYPTITAAVAAYNTSCIGGAVVFELKDAVYDTAETFPIVVGANASASALNTLTIKPAAGISPLITGSSASAIFVLDGADYVTIEGSNSPVVNTICPRVASGRNMTIANTSTSTTSAVVWMQTATGSNGAANNTIRDCNIVGSGNDLTLFGIGSGSSTIGYTSTGTGNNNNRIENDSVIACQTGIFSRGAGATNKNTGTVINQNLLNAPSPYNLRNNGIFTGFEDGIIISGNYLANIVNGASSDIIAINLGYGNNAVGNAVTTGSDVTNAAITYNRIDSIVQTNTWSALGIAVAGVTSGTTTIANNMISGVLAKGTGSDFSTGIFIGGAAGGVTNIFYNSVNITGTLTGASQPIFAMAITGSDPIVNVKNNVFVTSGSSGAGAYAMGLDYTGYTNLASDNNDFFSTGANLNKVGDLSTGGTSLATLPDWQTTTGRDAASKNAEPVFASSSDLHLTTAGANAPMMNTGTPVSITTDYDCAPRAVTPDMGVNEFTVPPCSSVVAGSVSAGTSAFCGSGATTLTVAGATIGPGITYQWRSSTDGTTWTNVAGAGTTAYTIAPAITATTYYRFVVTCTVSGVADSVTDTITINPLPAVTVTPDGGAYCSGTGTTITMTAAGALTYTWSPAAGLSATTGATVIASPTATTAYVVTGASAAGCTGTHTATVTVTTTPPPVAVTPAAGSICSGGNVALNASASLPSMIFTDSFNAGLGLWTVDNTGTTPVTAIPVTQWQIRADGYSYSTDVFHSPDVTSFVMVNADPGGSGSTTRSALVSPAFSLAGYTSATLTYQHYFRHIAGDSARVDISTDGGASWTMLNDYSTASAGSAGAFASVTASLAPYLGNNNCKLRFYYMGTWDWYWAVDNVAITGSGAFTNITWSPPTALYNDAALTSPYVTGTAASTVYAAPVATTAPAVITYTATATNGACTNTGISTITVNPLPDAGTVSGPATVCEGSNITLSTTGTGGNWVTIGTFTTVSPTGVVTGISAGTEPISYVVTNVCGTSIATTTVTVNPLPHAGTISGPDHVCGGGATITLTSTVPGGVWSASNGAATISPSGVVTGVVTGVDTISYAYTNMCGTDVTTYVINIDAAPDAGTVSGPGEVCAGSGITLVSTVSGGAWSSGTTTLATVSPAGVVSGVAPGTVVITYTFTNACGNDFAIYPVTINPSPAVYTVTGGGAYCAGGTGVPVGLSGSDVGITYRLYNGTLLVGTFAGTGGALNFGLQTAAGNYSVSAISPAGCTTDMPGNVVVAINPTTPPSVTIVPGITGAVCMGTAVTYSAVVTNPGVSPTYYWTVNGIVVSLFSTYTYIPSGGDVLKVRIISSSCAAIDSATSTIVPVVVNAATPAITIAATPGTTVCNGSLVTLNATVTYGGSAPQIRWRKNGVIVGSGASYAYVPANGDNVQATLVSNFQCRSADSAVSNLLALHTQAAAVPVVAIQAHPGALIAAGQADTLVAVVSNAGTAPAYQWALNGTNIPGANAPYYISSTFMNGDSVSVRVTSNAACGGGLQTHAWVIINVGAVGVNNVSQGQGDIRLMPNPNKGTFAVRGMLATRQDTEIYLEVVNMLGQVVYTGVAKANGGQIDEQVQLSSAIANGMYTLNIRAGSERQSIHFVVEQ